MRVSNFAVTLLLSAFGIAGAKDVSGYTKKNDTHIATHRCAAADHAWTNNYSIKGNVNPYTGKARKKQVAKLGKAQ